MRTILLVLPLLIVGCAFSGRAPSESGRYREENPKELERTFSELAKTASLREDDIEYVTLLRGRPEGFSRAEGVTVGVTTPHKYYLVKANILDYPTPAKLLDRFRRKSVKITSAFSVR